MSDSNLAGLDLNLLPALDMLLRERNVTRAARKMGLSQSALSHKLRHLRAHFDDPLLVASGGGLVPTERAESLAGPLRAALTELANAVRAGEPFDPASSERRFTIATADYGELALMPRIMHHVTEVAPRIEVVIESPRPDLVERLSTGVVDVAVQPHINEAAGLQRRRVLQEGFVVAARSGHPGIDGALTLERYLALSHILVTPGGGTHGIVDHLLAKRGLSRHIALRIPHFTGAPFIVERSNLIWTAPEFLAHRAQEYINLVLHEAPLELPATESYLIWHTRCQHDAGHRWLRNMLVELIGTVTE